VQGDDEAVVVTNEEANRMSLFFAYPTPMLKAVSDATTKFVNEVAPAPLSLLGLADVWWDRTTRFQSRTRPTFSALWPRYAES